MYSFIFLSLHVVAVLSSFNQSLSTFTTLRLSATWRHHRGAISWLAAACSSSVGCSPGQRRCRPQGPLGLRKKTHLLSTRHFALHVNFKNDNIWFHLPLLSRQEHRYISILNKCYDHPANLHNMRKKGKMYICLKEKKNGFLLKNKIWLEQLQFLAFGPSCCTLLETLVFRFFFQFKPKKKKKEIS